MIQEPTSQVPTPEHSTVAGVKSPERNSSVFQGDMLKLLPPLPNTGCGKAWAVSIHPQDFVHCSAVSDFPEGR